MSEVRQVASPEGDELFEKFVEVFGLLGLSGALALVEQVGRLEVLGLMLGCVDSI